MGGDSTETRGVVVSTSLLIGVESDGCLRFCPRSNVLCFRAEARGNGGFFRDPLGGMVRKMRVILRVGRRRENHKNSCVEGVGIPT